MSDTSKKLIKRSTDGGRFISRAEARASGAFTEMGPRVKQFHSAKTDVRKGASSNESLAERARRAAAAITDEEDVAITAGAMADPDAPPNRFIGRRRGRPKASSTKELVTLRLDPDVLR